jgi:hypothetical protein
MFPLSYYAKENDLESLKVASPTMLEQLLSVCYGHCPCPALFPYPLCLRAKHHSGHL